MAAPPPEQLALLRAVAAAPEEDTPRLAYADWLEEHGDAVQAAFIRYEITRERNPADPALKEQERHEPWKQWATRDRRANFLEYTASGWLTALGCRNVRDYWPAFQRGCVETVDSEGMLEEVLDDAPVLFDLQPVRTLSTFSENPDVHEAPVLQLAEAPGLARLRTLIFDGYRSSPAGYRALFHSPHVSGLRTLILHELDMTDDDVKVLATSPALTGLRRLDLVGHQLTPRAARLILTSPALRGVTHLGFGRTFGLVGSAALNDAERQAIGELRARFGSGLHLDYNPREHEGYYSGME